MSDARGSIRADEAVSLVELRRRFGWGEHSIRQARRQGLEFLTFGSQKYVLGADVLAFFRGLKGEK